MKEHTRSELIASSIKAHPEMTEAEIVKMIDNHIKAVREATIQEALAAVRDMRLDLVSQVFGKVHPGTGPASATGHHDLGLLKDLLKS